MRSFAPLKVCALLALTAYWTGCAQDVGDIDRTQPNRIEKNAFEGEWYFRQTVVDVNATAMSSFIGYEGQAYRVVFDIQENQLIARQFDEDIIGIEQGAPHGRPGQANRVGYNPVAAWRVSSHFDVQRSYNASTGEQSNVISENASDRPWYERNYVRVDWTRNLIDTQVDPLFGVQAVSSLTVTPQDSGEAPTLRFERNENGTVVYFDVLNTYVLSPSWIDCILYFGFPLYDGWCGPETVQVRSSFWRILDETPYEPRVYTDFDMTRFGFFRVERAVYDPRYGARDEGRIMLAKRWHIWERDYDAQGRLIPEAERVPRPIVFYGSLDFPEDLIEPSFDIAEQYSLAFRRTVAAVQGRSMDTVPRMFYFCLNPGGTNLTPPENATERQRQAYEVSNQAYRDGICEQPGVDKLLGDIRFSYFNWIHTLQRTGPAGYGPSSADPRTGRIFNANANMYGDVVNSYAQFGLDMIRMIEGELDPIAYGYGDAVRAYFAELRERGGDLFFQKSADGSLPRSIRDALYAMEQREQREIRFDQFLQNPNVQVAFAEGPNAFRLRNERQASRLPELAGTRLEREAMLPELRQLLIPEHLSAHAQGANVDWEDVLSPVRYASLETFMRLHERRERDLLAQNIHSASFYDNLLMATVNRVRQFRESIRDEVADDFELNERTWILLRQLIYRSIQEHEVGHTVGLRHNFEASTDALNYFPQYWALRQELTFDQDCDGRGFRTFPATGLGEGLPAPAPCDGFSSPEQEAEIHARVLRELELRGVHEFSLASVMDYGNPWGAFPGLGLYDYAAIAFGYGNLVEVWRNRSRPARLDIVANTNEGGDRLSGGATIRQSGERISDPRMRSVDNLVQRRASGRRVTVGGNRPWTYWHYSVIPGMFYGITPEPAEAATEGFAEANFGLPDQFYNFTGLGNMFALYDRELVPLDQARAQGRIQVPYRFCSDEYRGSSLECAIWDAGADELEIFSNTRMQYENYYTLDMFRRGRAGWGLFLLPVLNRMLGRYFLPSLRAFQYSLLRYANRGQVWGQMEFGGQAAYAALEGSVDFLGSVLTAPTPGTYVFDEAAGFFANVSESMDMDAVRASNEEYFGAQMMTVGIADGGRYGFSQFRRGRDGENRGERSYYSIFEYEIVTHFFAKYAALMALSRGDVDVVGADTSSDAGAYFLPPYLVFSDYMNRYLGSVIANDYRFAGWCARPNGSGMDMRPIRMLDTNRTPCQDGTLINPHTEAFGNRDFNTPYLAILYAAADLQGGLSYEWLDRTAVYVAGRDGDHLLCREGEPCDYVEESYLDRDANIRYVAYYPADENPLLDPASWHAGVQLLRRLQELDAEIAEIERTVGRTSSYWRANNLRGRLRDLVRLHVETTYFYRNLNSNSAGLLR